MFQYKTKGNVSPQGKRRVYFSCHPEDYERFFEQISTELLNITECAIWYSTDDGYEDIDTDLGQMNLIVVSVTTKLLTKPCRTMKLDVPFALKNHIPILPLMQEGGLDELYNRHFGDLHYLNPNARDDSALSYREKLKKYLNSVLIGDELAEKVRAAFDAYIFLSYRKKDRKYANELMRLIHKSDFCRDIAIWYDEYLTPGENFNDAISDALKKSDLFALVVTPNLVNEKNYVETMEYPAAIKQKKTILPAELETTDRNALSDHYPDIPNSIDARDETVLSKALEAALSRIARRENDSDPRHNFFIGLAYLDGIDVEVNHERALSLITFAAESKENRVPEAIEKLVSMYSEGYGVERDYRTAAEWQRKLVEHWESEYHKSHGIDDYRRLLSALLSLGDQFYALGNLEVAENTYRRSLALSERLEKDIDTAEIRCDLAANYNRLSRVRSERGDLDGAEEFQRKSFILCKQIAKETGSMVAKRNLVVSYDALGLLCEARGNLDEAEELYRKGLALNNHLADETKSVEESQMLALCYHRLGVLREARGDLDGAEEFQRKNIILYKQLVEETESMEARDGLLTSYERLGTLRKARGDLDETERIWYKCLALSEQLAEEVETLKAWQNLSIIYNDLGDLHNVRGDLGEAEEFYRKSIVLNERLVNETETVEIRRFLSVSYDNLGNLRQVRGDMDGAKEFYRKGLALFERLVKETRTIETRYDLLVSYSKLGDFCKVQGDLDEAEEFYQKCIALSERLTKETGNVRIRRAMFISYDKLGALCKTRDNLDEAEKFYQKCIALSEQFAEETGTVEAYYDLGASYFNIAIIRKPYHWSLLEKALQITTALAAQCPQITQYSELRDVIKNIFEQERNKISGIL